MAPPQKKRKVLEQLTPPFEDPSHPVWEDYHPQPGSQSWAHIPEEDRVKEDRIKNGKPALGHHKKPHSVPYVNRPLTVTPVHPLDPGSPLPTRSDPERSYPTVIGEGLGRHSSPFEFPYPYVQESGPADVDGYVEILANKQDQPDLVGREQPVDESPADALAALDHGMEDHRITHDQPDLEVRAQSLEHTHAEALAALGNGMEEHTVVHRKIKREQPDEGLPFPHLTDLSKGMEEHRIMHDRIGIIKREQSDDSLPFPHLADLNKGMEDHHIVHDRIGIIKRQESLLQNNTVNATISTSSFPSSARISTFPTGTGRPFSYNASLTYSSPTLTASSTSSDYGTSIVYATAPASTDVQSTSLPAPFAGIIGIAAQPGSPNLGSAASPPATPPSPPATIAGGVVGGAAGVAVVLLVAMLFLRWYRRQAQKKHQALLTPAGTLYKDSPSVSRSGAGMAERAALRPWSAALPALLRHQQPQQITAPQERSFQRISGRKLPSAWSPGMQAPPDMPPYCGYTAIRPDSTPMVANPFTDESDDGRVPSRQSSNEEMTFVDGPERKPTIHNPRRHLNVANADHTKHMSSMARTSGLGISSFE